MGFLRVIAQGMTGMLLFVRETFRKQEKEEK